MRALLTVLTGILFTAPAWASGGRCDTLPGSGLGDVSLLWVIPFAGLLLSIAIVPMVAGHWWHHNKNQLLTAVLWAAPVLLYLVYLAFTDVDKLGCEAGMGLTHAVEEYVSFIALLGSLFIISGGILLKGDLQGKPSINTAFLAIGAVLANVIGTTGASMLLIQPMLRTNSERKHTWHIPLFFIFLVSNIGGALTPIGDPPLFLGYLRGVPFFWTLIHLWWLWVPTVLVLLAVFFALDTVMYGREDAAHRSDDAQSVEPLGVEGTPNFLLLGGVIAAVLLLSPVHGAPADHADEAGDHHGVLYDGGAAGLAAASMLVTPQASASPEGHDAVAHDVQAPEAPEAAVVSGDAVAPDHDAAEAHPAGTEATLASTTPEQASQGHDASAADAHAGPADAHAAPHADGGHEDQLHAAATHAADHDEGWSLDPRDYFLREIVMAALAGLSLWLTSRRIRERNKFEFGPILEVAALFIGIFVAMVPATSMLQTHGGSLGLTEPWQFFWTTGALSAFLDNAPTYVTFASVACGIDPACLSANDLSPLTQGDSLMVLVAISLGAVFMGAGSYIGNGPNFMVRAIAENYTMERHTVDADGNEIVETIKPYNMPSFFGYIGYAAVFLLPVFILVSVVGLWLLA